MMRDNYWVTFWRSRGQSSIGADPQTRVFRTSNQQPIDSESWQRTLDYIHQQFPVGSDATLLDVCAGNGLFSREFAHLGAVVTAVDVSAGLLAELDALAHPRIQTICQDMRVLEFPEAQFSHVFLYAGIQYISHAETVLLLRACYRWLKPGGRLFLGDIPDAGLRWSFYNTPERRSFYFENLTKDQDVIGTWFERDWLQFLTEEIGFSVKTIHSQPEDQIYAHFRFDALLEK